MQETMCKRGETKMNEHEKLLEMSKPLIETSVLVQSVDPVSGSER